MRASRSAGAFDHLHLAVPVAVAGKLALSHFGTVDNATGGSLTLLSSAAGTALVVQDDNSAVTGTATVQRYLDPSLNPGLGYRHYSAPVSNATVADLATAGFSPEISQARAYNASATPGQITPFPTVYAYDQARVALTNAFAPFDRGFAVPAALSTPLAVGQGSLGGRRGPLPQPGPRGVCRTGAGRGRLRHGAGHAAQRPGPGGARANGGPARHRHHPHG